MNNKRQKQDADLSALKREIRQLEDRMMDLQREYASLADLIEEQKMTLHQFDSCAADFENTRQEWQWQLDGVLFYVANIRLLTGYGNAMQERITGQTGLLNQDRVYHIQEIMWETINRNEERLARLQSQINQYSMRIDGLYRRGSECR